MKRALVLSLSLLFAVSAQAENVWLKSIDQARKEAKRKNQLIFVDLFAEWCGWCHRAEADVFPSEPFKKVTGDMVLLRLDTEDRGDGTRLAQSLQVTSLPTFLILTDDMTLAGVIRGYAPAEQFSTHVVNTRKEWDKFAKDLASDNSANPAKDIDLAEQLIGRHGFARAQDKLKSLMANPKLSSDVRHRAYYTMAISQLSAGDPNSAVKTLDQLDKLKPAGKVLQDSVLLRAQIYLQQNQLRPALAEFKRYKAKYPKSDQSDFVNTVIPQLESALKQAQ